MGLINLLNDEVENFKFYTSKGYTGGGDEPGMKSLKFGKDRPGGGDSGQPYIQDLILDNPPPNSPDFLLRGGLNAPIDAAEDVVRLTKYMFDLKSPSGLLFIAKQNLLSRIAPKTEASKGAGYAGGALNEGVYTPLSTLAQAGVGFAGIHLNKQGIDPTGLLPGLGINKYNDIVNFDQPTKDNRLVNLSQYSLKDFNGIKGYDLNQGNDIITYGGGPRSYLGVGKTHIRYADQRTGKNNPKIPNEFFTNFGYDNYSIFKNPRPISWDGARIFNGNTVSGLYQDLTGVDPLKGKYSTTNNSTQLQLFSNSVYKPKTLNPILNLSGSNGYQANRSAALTKHGSESAKYVSPINTRLNSLGSGSTTGVSGSGRQLVTDLKYDLTTGTFVAQSFNGKNLGEYSSINTLWNDNLNERFDVSPKNHKKGYLANLDKNAGPYIDSNGNYTFKLAQYPRNIAPDFRKTNRSVRGFTDFSIGEKDGVTLGSYDYLTTSGSDYISSEAKIIDRIYYKSAQTRSSNELNEENDLIPFRFEIINPTNPTKSTETLTFRAYIDNLSDTYSPEWKSQTYMGRAEKFYKYDSFDRSISLGFTIVADNKANLDTMYTQLNTLAASLAPTYTTQGYMAGNLHKLTIGNYIYNQVGIINGFTYEIMDESPWDIDKNLPFYIKVTGIKFTPIHNFRPESQFKTPHQYINQS